MEREKRHAACDECRKRKLKCSGELESCQRCRNLQITCIYSPTKQMGRPKKRRLDEAATQPVGGSADYSSLEPAFQNGVDNAIQDNRYSSQTSSTPRSLSQASLLEHAYLASQTHYTSNTPPDISVQGLANDLTPLPLPIQLPNDSRTSNSGNACACLAHMYLATADLQSGPRNFPFHLKPIRAAIMTVNELLHCQACRAKIKAGEQNMLFVTSLLHTIVDHIGQLLRAIDDDARAAEANHTRKQLCLGDDSVENFHLHSHGPHCPARFTVNLDPEEWRIIAKRTVVEELRDAPDDRLTLEGMLDKLEARQHTWHAICAADPSLAPSYDLPLIPGDFTCLRLLNNVRRSVQNLPIS